MKHVLMVSDDFYKKDLRVGDEMGQLVGRLKVLDLAHENEFGTFILCEYFDTAKEEGTETKWTKKNGIAPKAGNPLEIVGTIHIPGYRNLMRGIGFFVKNHDSNEVLGMSYQQAWNAIFHEGARNALATSSHLNNFHTQLIDTVDGLPALDSCYWKIPAYNSEGEPFAPFTKAALAQLKNGMRHAVSGLVRERAQQSSVDPSFEDLSDIAKIRPLSKIAVLSGAGLSTASGIPDYRSSVESLWRKNPDVLSKLNQASFERNPDDFWKAMYELIEKTLEPITPFPTHEALVATIQSLQPSFGHRFLAWIAQELQKDVTIITQNIDGLDKKAGSEKVIEMHGNIHECVCPECSRLYPLVNVLKKNEAPICDCGAVLRPNVAFFGDMVQGYDEAKDTVKNADLILVVGTSLQVAPFNQLILEKNEHAKVVLINDSPIEHLETDYALYGQIPSIFHKLKELWGFDHKE
ncbi:SIR2 family NAD-dependent protein deacylase [Paenisporosarcina sp. NPDC076898]|uniref:SIR2 family NAD-dependent protein deacylase n=1 Tax=unclassified Paenisporosarcina TaxID=2642018 RepID=UPI003D032D6E